MKIAVVGCGYVGLVSGACFASLGNTVICVDNNAKKIALLKAGRMPIYEPGLEELVRQGVRARNLSFTSNLSGAARASDVVFIAVGTPPLPRGDADLSFVERVAVEIARTIDGYKLIVEKSTVPVQTGEWIRRTIQRHAKKGAAFDVASNPEFLREGTAIQDFLKPDRVILGVDSNRAKKVLTDLYAPLKCPVLVTDIKSAEIIKHASNSFLATKISFINAIGIICEEARADVEQVAIGMGMDRRIGKDFLNAGIGFGGFCFPKDLASFIRIAEKLGYHFGLLREVGNINEAQKARFIEKTRRALGTLKGRHIGVLGLSFKPNTDDMRYAPSLDIIEKFLAEGAQVRAFDPHANANALAFLKERRIGLTGFGLCADSYSACRGADAVAVLTEWNEFKELDLKKLKRLMKRPLIIDGRNVYDPKKMRALGFDYYSVGRP